MLQLIVSGLVVGCIYSLVAFGYNVTWTTSRSLNFAQGSAVMLGAVLGLVLLVDLSWAPVIALPGSILALAVFGVALERFAVRPFIHALSMGWVLSTLAVGIVVENVAMLIFGKVPRALPTPLMQEPLYFSGVGVYPLELLFPVTMLAVMIGGELFYRHTMFGRALRATAFDQEAARAMGIDVNRVVAFAFAVSAALAALAGLLLGPLTGVTTSMGFLVGLKAFAVAIIGGLTSPLGIVVAGLLYGVAENLVGSFVGSSAKQIFGFGLVILVLFLRPTGLLGKQVLRKV